ncbi:MAG: SH3 domain-containing protein [Eubacteriales bacterium]|nr:SH3 domain-containing protein [Eubacteriales bacterium]
MDTIREWISDNLRYILLGLALILVLAVAIIGIRAISNIASGGSPLPKTQETEKVTEAETATEKTSDVIVETNAPVDTGSLIQNDGKVLTTMTSYYSARTNGDTATLQKLDPETGGQDTANSYVESYSNIKTYSKEGPASGSYVVYVCYDGKVKDIDTYVPSLTQFYLKTNEDGTLYIADAESDAQAKQFVEETTASTEVQNLIASVQEECKAAEDSDPALKEFMNTYGNSQGENSVEGSAGDSSEMVANDEVYVRAEASTEAEILGGLYIGETVTKISETDDGWTQIDYNGQTAYVKSEFLSTPEQAQSESEADYFAPAAAEDGTSDDGAVEDGAAEDEALEDGAAEDGYAEDGAAA